MNLTKKLLQTTLLASMTFIASGCFYTTVEPAELAKANEISINGTNYTPEFKGLDSYYLAQEELVHGKEENWYIHNEKLYLFLDEDTKEEWFRHIDIISEAAQKHWELINKPSQEEEFDEMTDAFLNGTSN